MVRSSDSSSVWRIRKGSSAPSEDDSLPRQTCALEPTDIKFWFKMLGRVKRVMTKSCSDDSFEERLESELQISF